MDSQVKTRTNEYIISIEMNSTSSKLILDKELLPYPQSKIYKDEITIRNNKISIIARRSNKVDMNGIFTNHNSTLFRQITKALVYYYCATRKPIQIKSIAIELISTKPHKSIKLKSNDINQVVDKNADLSNLKNIKLDYLKNIFLETQKSHGYLYGLTFLIKSLHADSQHGKFENKWKAFNAIYKAAAKKTSDHDCHIFVRQHMTTNYASYPLISSKINGMSVDEIRNNIRWNKFILNDFATINKTKAFRDFILRNEDSRLIRIIRDTITIRDGFLKSQGFYNDVMTHLNKYENTINDSHLAATLCIKYAYFARNKLIHAENIESGFRLVPLNKEEKEVTWLSCLLELLIIDLINNYNDF